MLVGFVFPENRAKAPASAAPAASRLVRPIPQSSVVRFLSAKKLPTLLANGEATINGLSLPTFEVLDVGARFSRVALQSGPESTIYVQTHDGHWHPVDASAFQARQIIKSIQAILGAQRAHANTLKSLSRTAVPLARPEELSAFHKFATNIFISLQQIIEWVLLFQTRQQQLLAT
ncbi:MAG: hypothetical protein VKK59_01265 [Vampirovibrionales bacterium]|nr:hypothetical protein [Vampirovibrionales bacterium]